MKTKLIFLLLVSCFLLLTSHVYAFTIYNDTDCLTHGRKGPAATPAGDGPGGPCENVKNTRHNLSASGPAGRNVSTTGTTEICVFCHTPHGSNPDATSLGAPIWNRKLSATSYQMYDQVWSKSFEGISNTGQPTGFSRLCLACHDGTIALGRMINLPGSGGFVSKDNPILQSFSMTYQGGQTSGCVGADCIPIGAGVLTGDTRLLGADLKNDHAISFFFNTNLANIDGELVDPGSSITLHTAPSVSLTTPGIDPKISPLKRYPPALSGNPNDIESVQCTSCHNPHQVDFPKFLRANRLMLDFAGGACPEGGGVSCPPSNKSTFVLEGNPPTSTPPKTAIVCLFCHDKPGVPYGGSGADGAGLSTHFTDPTHINLDNINKDGPALTTDLVGTTAQPLSSVINKTPGTEISISTGSTQTVSGTVAVAQRACLACHDPHTESGSVRILRQGAENNFITSDVNNACPTPPCVAIEQTCYQCHSPTNKTFNAIEADSADPNACPPAGGNFPDCPPDILTQFMKDAGTVNENTADPPFSAPEFGLTPTLPTAGVNDTCSSGLNNSCGSAMNLRLGLGHQPVFVNYQREGVQLGDEDPTGVNTGAPQAPIFGGPLTVPGGSGGDKNKRTSVASGLNVANTPDTRHIECVDCHNMHRVNRSNRFRGMPGITIFPDNTNPDSAPYNTGDSTLIVGPTIVSADIKNREPYIFEVCLRCHGNSFNAHVREQRITANGTGLKVQLRGNNPVPSTIFTYTGANPSSTTLGAGSNKRKEFDPNARPFYDANPATSPLVNEPKLSAPGVGKTCNDTIQTDCNNGLPGFNTSFHPVAAPGRNQSGVLNNENDTPPGQLRTQKPTDPTNINYWLSRRRTIHCTDCHNSDLFGTYAGGQAKPINSNANPASISVPDFPGPITFDGTRGTVHKRPQPSPSSPFSWAPDYLGDLGANPCIPISPLVNNPCGVSVPSTALNNPNTPQGPHGSRWRRILRSNYDTTLAADENQGPGSYDSQRFALCFNCHNEAAFVTQSWPTVANGSNRLTNFYRGKTPGAGGPTGNLHQFHLSGMPKAGCHECHNNVHSNIESGNTLYVNLPGLEAVNAINNQITNPGHASSTHLLNFAPEITKHQSQNGFPNPITINNPVWGNGLDVNGANGTGTDTVHLGPGCNLRCHGFDMQHNYDAHSVTQSDTITNGVHKCTEPNGCVQ